MINILIVLYRISFYANLQLFYIFTQLNEEIIKKPSIQVFTHLIQNKPIADRAVFDVTSNPDSVFLVLEVSKKNKVGI